MDKGKRGAPAPHGAKNLDPQHDTCEHFAWMQSATENSSENFLFKSVYNTDIDDDIAGIHPMNCKY